MRSFFLTIPILALSAAHATLSAQDFSSQWITPSQGVVNYVDPPKDDAQPISFTEPGVASPSDAVPSLSDAINSPSDALPTMGDYITPARCTYFQADGLYWGRVGTGCNQVLAIDSNATSGSDTLLQTSNLNFNGTGGMRFLLGWTPDPCRGCSRCCAYEVGYFGLFGWQAHARVQGSGNLAIPGDLGVASNNFFGADALDINYRSSLHNLEFNCVKTCCLCDATLDFLCGFRFITLQERFTIAGTDLQEGTSSYDVKANNYLYGGQLGGRYTRHYSCWSLQLTGKAGVFLNDMSQSQVVTDFPNVGGPFFLRNRIRADGTGVAALGEIGATAIRPINDTWSLRLGYMALGLGGVALAPDQLDFTDNFNSGSNLQKNGWIFVHGAVMGAEARW